MYVTNTVVTEQGTQYTIVFENDSSMTGVRMSECTARKLYAELRIGGYGLLRRPSHHPHPRGRQRAVHPQDGDQRAVRRSPLRRARPLEPARTPPGRQDDLPLRLPHPARSP